MLRTFLLTISSTRAFGHTFFYLMSNEVLRGQWRLMEREFRLFSLPDIEVIHTRSGLVVSIGMATFVTLIPQRHIRRSCGLGPETDCPDVFTF